MCSLCPTLREALRVSPAPDATRISYGDAARSLLACACAYAQAVWALRLRSRLGRESVIRAVSPLRVYVVYFFIILRKSCL